MPILELTVASRDQLLVNHFTVNEAVSDLFSVDIVARIKKPDVRLDAIVGQPAMLRVVAGWSYVKALGARCWRGICSFAEQVQGQSEETGLSTYHLQIVPDLWLLTQGSTHRIFQHLSIPDIVDTILSERRIEPAWQIDRAAYPKLEFKVQYGESDYAFLCRLLEEVGITFTFPDRGGEGNVLTFNDKPQAAAPRAPIPYVDNPNQSAQKEFLSSVRLAHEVRPGAYTIRDHDFRNPSFQLLGKAPPAAAPEGQYEHYRYAPGAFLAEGTMGGGGTPVADDKGVARHDPKYGADLAERGLLSMRADKRTVAFDTNTIDLYPGAIFSVEEHVHPDLGAGAHLLVTSFSVEGTPGGEWSMRGRAVFADPRAPYRPPQKTPKPQVFGVQSAAVVGPPGKEIHTDEFGRVRVQFPWDREGKNDDSSSCWMRVSQGWAGTGYGMITIPRVGQEVLVTFLDGDPDRPLVTGRVYNAVEQVPYKLPDDMTVSTWKSHSSPTTGGYNELKFDDKAGQERVYVQAERDLHKLVKNDEVLRTQHDKQETVDGTSDLVVKGVRKQLVESADHLHVKMDQRSQVDGSVSLTVRMGQQEKVGTDYALDAGQEIHLKAGMTLVLEAGMRLTIKGPAGFIDFHPAGIDIVGLLVNINSGGAPGFGKGSSPDAPEDAVEAQPRDRPPGAATTTSSGGGRPGTTGQGGV